MTKALRPRSRRVLGRDKLLGIIGHQVAQCALSGLLDESKLDDILPRSTVLGKIFGRGVEFVAGKEASSVDVVEDKTYERLLN